MRLHAPVLVPVPVRVPVRVRVPVCGVSLPLAQCECKEQDYRWAIEVAYAFSWRELCGKCTRKPARQQGGKEARRRAGAAERIKEQIRKREGNQEVTQEKIEIKEEVLRSISLTTFN